MPIEKVRLPARITPRWLDTYGACSRGRDYVSRNGDGDHGVPVTRETLRLVLDAGDDGGEFVAWLMWRPIADRLHTPDRRELTSRLRELDDRISRTYLDLWRVVGALPRVCRTGGQGTVSLGRVVYRFAHYIHRDALAEVVEEYVELPD